MLLVAWGIGSYLSVASGVQAANDRVPAGVDVSSRSVTGYSSRLPTTILVLGTDGGDRTGRQGANRADSIMLLRTDPGKRRLAYLSIPRDLQVEIPEVGLAKINAANQFGGPALALRTVKDLTGLDVNHVVFVDFDRFEELIDAVGGIDVDVPRPIRSNRFDCPYRDGRALCAHGRAGGSRKGVQHMDGRRALVYSRIRHNLLHPSETDFDRARRQQQVVAASARQGDERRHRAPAPFVGGDLVKPLATDLSAWELMQLGWVYFRADTGRALHCRLGGDPATVGGESVILGTEDNVSTVAMFTGPVRTAPAAARAAVRARDASSGTEPHASGFEESDFFASAAAAGFSDCRAAPVRRRRARVAVLRPTCASRGRSRWRRTRALEMHCDREQHLLDRPRPAGLAHARGASLIRWNTSNVWPFGQRYS